jgi:hypothetical protein
MEFGARTGPKCSGQNRSPISRPSPHHFKPFQRNARSWSALFQQRPALEKGDYFRSDWLPDRAAAAARAAADLRRLT